MSLGRFLLRNLAKCRPPAPANFIARRNFSTTNILRSSPDDWIYRNNYHPSYSNKNDVLLVKCMTGFFWWWILYHLWHESEEVFPGEWVMIDPKTWSDEELGIPPDDYEE